MSARTLALLFIGGLYFASVPWYREGGAAPALWLGLPDWAAAALVCYAAIAALNAFAWLRTEVRDTVEDGPAAEWRGGALDAAAASDAGDADEADDAARRAR